MIFCCSGWCCCQHQRGGCGQPRPARQQGGPGAGQPGGLRLQAAAGGVQDSQEVHQGDGGGGQEEEGKVIGFFIIKVLMNYLYYRDID